MSEQVTNLLSFPAGQALVVRQVQEQGGQVTKQCLSSLQAPLAPAPLHLPLQHLRARAGFRPGQVLKQNRFQGRAGFNAG